MLPGMHVKRAFGFSPTRGRAPAAGRGYKLLQRPETPGSTDPDPLQPLVHAAGAATFVDALLQEAGARLRDLGHAARVH